MLHWTPQLRHANGLLDAIPDRAEQTNKKPKETQCVCEEKKNDLKIKRYKKMTECIHFLPLDLHMRKKKMFQ